MTHADTNGATPARLLVTVPWGTGFRISQAAPPQDVPAGAIYVTEYTPGLPVKIRHVVTRTFALAWITAGSRIARGIHVSTHGADREYRLDPPLRVQFNERVSVWLTNDTEVPAVPMSATILHDPDAASPDSEAPAGERVPGAPNVPDMAPGESWELPYAGSRFQVTRTSLVGVHSGRPRYHVRCIGCDTVVHEATTGPRQMAEAHMREVHQAWRNVLDGYQDHQPQITRARDVEPDPETYQIHGHAVVGPHLHITLDHVIDLLHMRAPDDPPGLPTVSMMGAISELVALLNSAYGQGQRHPLHHAPSPAPSPGVRHYRHRRTIEAMHWTDTDADRERFAAWFEHHDDMLETRGPEIALPEGGTAAVGAWVLHTGGGFIAMSPELFTQNYEEVP